MRTYLGSLGCKLNQSEMDALAELLAQAGHEIVASPAQADLCILNTCAVTGVAAQKSRQALRRLHRENPDASLVATGCYAELSPGDLQTLPGVQLVAGTQAKERLAELLAGPGTPPGSVGDLRPSLGGTHTRSLVKIQDGCDNACTYCIIHRVRGPQRSRPPDEVVAEVRARREAGYQEVVLTGVHIGAYGQDRDARALGVDLWGLVARILAETDLPRLRLSSIEPWDLPESALRLWDDPRLCRHLHLPLQSGCDATLRRMARRYSSAGFAGLVAAARSGIPDLAVTTDLIVGFPGETDEEFAESLAFFRSLGLARAHVFPFSPRPGTPAATMPGQVPAPVKAERAGAMRRMAEASARAFQQQFIGRTLEVLWESACESAAGPVWSGLTGNYLRVSVASTAPLHNSLTPVRLTTLVDGCLQGRLET
jgi:threonylcarbamoyladenosine tRNA methylthiotransferase MtaB